jgi:quinol monooxygenase YgiN
MIRSGQVRRQTGSMALVEFMRFRVQRGNVTALLQARSTMIETFRAENAGYRGGLIVRIGEDDWLDLAVWDNEAACDAALRIPRTATVIFLELIDEVLGQERGTVIDGS